MKKNKQKIVEDSLWMLLCGLQVTMNTIRMIDTGAYFYVIFIILFSMLFGCWTAVLTKDINEKR